jgi:hypothetical protein
MVQLEERLELLNTAILKQGKKRISSEVIEGKFHYKVCLIFNYIVKVKVAKYMILEIEMIVDHWPISMASM